MIRFKKQRRKVHERVRYEEHDSSLLHRHLGVCGVDDVLLTQESTLLYCRNFSQTFIVSTPVVASSIFLLKRFNTFTRV
ncbi:hypothetical protein KOW79_022168 [Hemibagrus wyckioides]|uniref:Uncharacterized protein n=1 Tax=Hemibagrus wyckioides TaxID=337641 RepID=A0A9D3N5H1_9TELE|nr:hypothetical protein KOW79_022168 [Hemibagrus wyckioides]